MTTGCKCVRLSTCELVPLLSLPLCLTAPSVPCSVCLLYDVLRGPRVGAAPVSLVGRWLCVPMPTASCGEPHPTVGLYLYPPMP